MEYQFRNFGGHCAMPECGEYLFLPFKCGDCRKMYCEAHRRYEDHGCTAHVDLSHVPVCPLCAHPIPLAKGDDRDTVVERHIAAGCPVPARTVLPQRESAPCEMEGCTETHHFARIRCADCRKTFCVAHRHAEDHDCSVRRKKQQHQQQQQQQQQQQPRAAATPAQTVASAGVLRVPNVHRDDLFTIYMVVPSVAAAGEGGQSQSLVRRLEVNSKWSVGRTIEWVCGQLGIKNVIEKRHRFVSLEDTAVAVVPNLQVVGMSGKTKDNGAQYSDLRTVALLPEEWINNASNVTSALQHECGAAAVLPDTCRDVSWQQQQAMWRKAIKAYGA